MPVCVSIFSPILVFASVFPQTHTPGALDTGLFGTQNELLGHWHVDFRVGTARDLRRTAASGVRFAFRPRARAHEQRVGTHIGIAAGSIAQRVPKGHLVAAHVVVTPLPRSDHANAG